MFKKIVGFFKEQGWSSMQIEDKTLSILGISGENGKFQCVADVREDESKFMFLSICSANVPEHKKIGMCELLTRLNYGKFLGNFEMDYEDGEIRFKTSVYYHSVELTTEIIETLVITNVQTMDAALVGIMQLIYGDITPLEACKIIERAETVE